MQKRHLARRALAAAALLAALGAPQAFAADVICNPQTTVDLYNQMNKDIADAAAAEQAVTDSGMKSATNTADGLGLNFSCADAIINGIGGSFSVPGYDMILQYARNLANGLINQACNQVRQEIGKVTSRTTVSILPGLNVSGGVGLGAGNGLSINNQSVYKPDLSGAMGIANGTTSTINSAANNAINSALQSTGVSSAASQASSAAQSASSSAQSSLSSAASNVKSWIFGN